MVWVRSPGKLGGSANVQLPVRLVVLHDASNSIGPPSSQSAGQTQGLAYEDFSKALIIASS